MYTLLFCRKMPTTDTEFRGTPGHERSQYFAGVYSILPELLTTFFTLHPSHSIKYPLNPLN